MPNVAAIDGVTGPGRRTVLIQNDVQEITFRLKRKVIDVINRDGSLGSYDLAAVSSVQFKNDEGEGFILAVVSKEDTDGGTSKTERRSEASEFRPLGPAKATEPSKGIPSKTPAGRP